MKAAIATLLASAILARAHLVSTSEPPMAQITAAAATTKPESSTSDVKGLAFDRFYQVWLENIVSTASRLLTSLFVDMFTRTTMTRRPTPTCSGWPLRVFSCK